jgi:hypothetical protein
MRRNANALFRPSVIATLAALVLAGVTWSPLGAASGTLRTLILGGGPDLRHNQVAIERNVFYVSRLLPSGSPRFTLFADGANTSETVLFEEQQKVLPPGERIFGFLFRGRGQDETTLLRYRAPQLGRLDGPSDRASVNRGFEWLRREASGPVLLYFTGHGSQARGGNLDNNAYDLWGSEKLSVRDLAGQIATLPPRVPVTLVMVQCFSGAFGNVLFAGGDPAAAAVDRKIAGFFAAPRERTAAGCTPEVDEAEYHDFTSYFFAALSGRDRVGRTVTGADYNRDGRVGMDEAFAYSLAHDVSIDVPVATSDVFLRRGTTTPDEEIFRTEYSQALRWATPAQKAALEELSAALKLAGENRLAEGYQRMVAGTQPGGGAEMRAVRARFNAARDEIRQSLQDRWPELRRRGGAGFAAAREQAIDELTKRAEEGRLRPLLEAEQAMSQVEEKQYQAELDDARVLRFVRLSKSIVLAHQLRETGNAADRAVFERIVTAESAPFPPPAATTAARPAGD